MSYIKKSTIFERGNWEISLGLDTKCNDLFCIRLDIRRDEFWFVLEVLYVGFSIIKC